MTTPRPPLIIFVNRYFAPDHSATSQMLSDIAFGLANSGSSIAVITSRLLYDDPDRRLKAAETLQNVTVHRVWTSRFGRAILAGRAIDYLTFYLTAAWKLFWTARRGDIVVVKTDPPMLASVLGPVAGLRGARLVNWLQDVFPEVAQVLGFGQSTLARPAYWLLLKLRNRALETAKANIVLGAAMAGRVAAAGACETSIRIIPNFADGQNIRPIGPDLNPLRRAWGLDSKFVVGYSGNLGRAHEYKTFLRAIEEVERRDPERITWLFVGGGALYETFRQEVLRRELRSIRFEPYQSRDRLAESLSAADVHLVTLRADLEGLIVPSKFYGIAAAGRPTIFIGDCNGEIARIIDRFDRGFCVSEGEGEALVDTTLMAANSPETLARMGNNARKAFEENYDLPLAVARWQALLADLT